MIAGSPEIERLLLQPVKWQIPAKWAVVSCTDLEHTSDTNVRVLCPFSRKSAFSPHLEGRKQERQVGNGLDISTVY